MADKPERAYVSLLEIQAKSLDGTISATLKDFEKMLPLLKGGKPKRKYFRSKDTGQEEDFVDWVLERSHYFRRSYLRVALTASRLTFLTTGVFEPYIMAGAGVHKRASLDDMSDWTEEQLYPVSIDEIETLPTVLGVAIREVF